MMYHHEFAPAVSFVRDKMSACMCNMKSLFLLLKLTTAVAVNKNPASERGRWLGVMHGKC